MLSYMNITIIHDTYISVPTLDTVPGTFTGQRDTIVSALTGLKIQQYTFQMTLLHADMQSNSSVYTA